MSCADEEGMFCSDDKKEAARDAEEAKCLSLITGQIPKAIQDTGLCGYAVDSKLKCFHGFVPLRQVAFEGVDTGRRFIGCMCSDHEVCNLVVWHDPEHPPHMQRALQLLWSMAESGEKMRAENVALVNQLAVEKLQAVEEKDRAEEEKSKALEEKNKALEEKNKAEEEKNNAVDELKATYQLKIKKLKSLLENREKWLVMSVGCNVAFVAFICGICAIKLVF